MTSAAYSIWPSHIRFVLVETTEPGNVGSVCRVLANFGFAPGDLVLVDPHCDWRSAKAISRAGQAHEWLNQLWVVPNLTEAVGDCVRTVGTTAQVIEKFRRQFARPLREAMPDLIPQTRERPLAILFGIEQTGLTHEQLLACDELITIPTAPVYPALNMAVSVGIVAYEISQGAGEAELGVRNITSPDHEGGVRKNQESEENVETLKSRKAEIEEEKVETQPSVLRLQSSPSPDHPITRSPDSEIEIPPEEQPAEARLVQIMFQELYRAAETIEFFNPQNPLPLQYALRRILGKAHLTNQEARVLLGLARQILWKCGKRP